MKNLILIASLLIFISPIKSQEGFDDYHFRNDFLMTSPGAMKLGLYGYDNPALLNYVKNPDLMLAWSDEFGGFNRRGLFLSMPSLGNLPPVGLATISHSDGNKRVVDYKLSSAFGNKRFGIGASFNLPIRDTEHFNRKSHFSLGTLYRHNRHFSFGFIGTSVTNFNHYEGVVDLAIRPFGNEKLTVFGDYALRNNMKIFDRNWSAGFAVKPFTGTWITGRFFNNNSFTVGLEYSLGNFGISTQGSFDDSFKYNHNTYAVRVGSYEENIPQQVFRNPKNYASIDLNKPMRYQKYQHFDNANTLLEKLNLINDAAESHRIGGIVINTSGMNINHTMSWELREQLKKFREKDKKVFVFIDNADMNTYHFASVADVIIMHPLGSVNLPGYIKGNIYLGNMLEKIGIGVKEFKFHEYKSGFEPLAGKKMSCEDRKQQQKLVDNIYNFVKQDIITSREFEEEKYEKLVNEIFYFTADQAIEYGLVDRLGRWDDVDVIIELITGSEKTILDENRQRRILQRSDYEWGKKPRIAVVYADGFCDMETGMQARSLAKDISKARKNNDIKAIVLRVESPGGSIMALDIISEELRKAKKKKPVIISQGSVAASGGYWLSIYGDRIVTAPNTMTGSIGVISGWLYDDGIKEKIGYSTDYVKKGEFADLGFGVPVPILNIPILDRSFKDHEEEVVKNMLFNTYEIFVNQIVDERGIKYDEIEKLSRGRIWSGTDAIEIGLVDTLGGLKTALDIAAKKAGLSIDDDYAIVEYPEPGLFSSSGFIAFMISRLLNLETPEEIEDPVTKYLKFMQRHNAKPLPVLPMEYMNYYLQESKIFE